MATFASPETSPTPTAVTNLIEATTNLTTWTPVLTNSAGLCNFIDSNSAAFPTRFYRAVLTQ